ncbi:putative sulfate exporter family transporter [Streptomyces sp. NBS 14/10]|uniref:YeiH family protein n=1 Tax=Streptomyces sp. NBS 14/10 TaxID=1945643 RepID=UPI000B7E910D|nr:putative sulfate exporter family transporter [Streptomyces sp. NBS 14/10]KAK1185490.1 putative sulfate exporter family transporter [Streptomyces sp. NBS 14/10]
MIKPGHVVGRSTDAAGPVRSLLPGLLVAAVGTAAAFSLNKLVPAVSALTVAVVLGVAVGGRLPAKTREGLGWATKKFLRLGVVLLGLQLGLGEVFGLGAGKVLAVVVTVLVAFFGTLLLGRLIRVPKGLALMVATGFSICGASAIAAMDSVAETDKEDVATAVTLVTLYGSAAIVLVPFLGQALGMSPQQVGFWAGLSVHEVAQVVAAASPAGAGAVAIAVVIKLTRVVLLAPMVAGVSIVERRQGGASTGKRPAIVPLFVLGFLVMMLVRSSGVVPSPALSVAKVVTTLLFTAALFGLGSGVKIGALLRAGRRGLALGALSTLLVAVVGYGALTVVGV